MAVYERGYRTYQGDLSGPPAWYVIYREGYRLAFRSKGFRIIAGLFVIWFVIWGAWLYFEIGVTETLERGSRGAFKSEETDAFRLTRMLLVFYGGLGILTGLLSILIGAGLISGDLRTRALSLYLVRPIRAWEYVLGKAIILPRVLIWFCLLPGLLYYLLVGMWQPPGETFEWLAGNLGIVSDILLHFVVAALGYTGLMLFLSARTERGSAVVSVAAAILFAGSLLSGIMSRLPGVGPIMKYAGLPVNTVSPFAWRSANHALERTLARAAEIRAEAAKTIMSDPEEAATILGRAQRVDLRAEHLERVLDFIPRPEVAVAISAGLLCLGLWSALARARTVEVSA